MATLPPVSQGIRAALMSNPWFARLPDVIRGDIVSRARGRTLAARERLFSRGEVSDGIYVVIEGTVSVSGVTRDGRETILDFYGPGAWIGEVSVLGGGPRMHDAEANCDALVLQLSPPDVEDLLSSHSAFSRALLRLEAQRLQIVLAAIESYSAQSMEQRLAIRLLMLADHHGAPTTRGVEIRLELSHETLARLIGSSRQRVNHILNDWKRSGTIEHHYGRIVFLDRAGLEKLARM